MRAAPRQTRHARPRHGHVSCRGTRHPPRRRRAPAPPGARFRRSGGPFPAQRRGAPAAAALRPAHAARLRRRAGEHWSGRLWWLLPMLPVLQLPPKPTGRIPPGQDERTGSCRLRSLRARTMRPNGDRQGRYSWHGLRRAAAVVGGGGRQVRTVAGRERPQAWGWPGLSVRGLADSPQPWTTGSGNAETGPKRAARTAAQSMVPAGSLQVLRHPSFQHAICDVSAISVPCAVLPARGRHQAGRRATGGSFRRPGQPACPGRR